MTLTFQADFSCILFFTFRTDIARLSENNIAILSYNADECCQGGYLLMKKKRKARGAAKMLLIISLSGAILSPLYYGSIFAAEEKGTACEYHVSPLGDDGAEGTIDSPFATIEKAQGMIHQLAESEELPDGGITVYLHGGRYPVSETISIPASDSGTASCPITYKAYGDGEVYIDGGVTLTAEKFAPADEAMLSRIIDPSAKANLMVYDMKADGIDYSEYIRRGCHSSILPDCRLYINGEIGRAHV